MGIARWLLLIPVLIVAGCGTDDLPFAGSDCDTDQVTANLQDVAERWDDALEIAQSSSRISLAGPVSELQDIRRETRAQDWPDCAGEAQTALVDWMDETIKGFIAFMSQESDSEVQEYFERANDHRADFRRALRDIQD